MHPNAAFDWLDPQEMLDFAAREAFATIAIEGPAVVHAPLSVEGRGVAFHVARRNRAAERIDGSRVIASVVGRHGYHSPNWYARADQVPTWLYETVEIEGVARRLDTDALAAQVERLSNAMERIHSPDRIWTRAKMGAGKFEAMLNAIVGFSIEIEAIRGTRKLNQHKSADDVEATISGQLAAGRSDLAAVIRAVQP